jgi:hypothetical protein
MHKSTYKEGIVNKSFFEARMAHTRQSKQSAKSIIIIFCYFFCSIRAQDVFTGSKDDVQSRLSFCS